MESMAADMQIRSRYRIPTAGRAGPAPGSGRASARPAGGRHPREHRGRGSPWTTPPRGRGTRIAATSSRPDGAGSPLAGRHGRLSARTAASTTPGNACDAFPSARPGWLADRAADAESSLAPRAAPMLIGYVSDERYLALSDVALEFVDDRGRSWEARSRATGAVARSISRPGATPSPCSTPASVRSAAEVIGARPVAAPVPAALRRAERLRLAQMGPRRRGRRVPRPLRRAVQPGTVALRLDARTRPRASAGSTSTARGRRCRSRPTATTPDRRGVEQGRLQQPDAPAVRRGPRSQRAVLLPRPHALGTRGSPSPGSSRRRGPPLPWPCWPATSPGMRTTTSAAAATTSTPTSCRPRRPSTPAQDLLRYRDAEFLSWTRRRTRRCRSTAPSRSTTSTSTSAITDPIEGRQACHLAPAEWRLLGWLEHRGLPYDFYAETQLDDGTLDLSAYRVLDPRRPSRVLDAADVRPRQAVGLPGGRPPAVPRRQRPELRGRDPGLVDGGSTTARSPGLDVAGVGGGEPVRPAPRVGGQPARRGLHAPRRDDRRPVPGRGRRPLGLRPDRPEGGRPLRPEVLAPALPRRRIRARDRQALAQFAPECAAAGEGTEPRRRRCPCRASSTPRAAAPSSRSARSPGSAASRWTSPSHRSPRTSSAGSWISTLAIEDESRHELEHPQDRGPRSSIIRSARTGRSSRRWAVTRRPIT